MSKLRGYRVMLGHTQADMGKILGITKQAYSSKETGKTSFSKSEMLKIRDMVRAIEPDITIDELFFS
ncbi:MULTISPECIES: helix-turn-helix transcriptional regulator [unclassified Streptococcus]|uniref:helix-turn-helix transcriptional regulator n=1 Tax=unclassified Streptococcus TaxID=2608887 RepID=UPI0010729B27|nr:MULTISPECIES: helix-turn-helix domain-containing protein [unclassified Streptococcus]MBF0806457.1 helix-turn-helix domain-containing protein [Streptococcus sp. 19428wA2_WM07]TFU27896.1 helix-turn-helix domain-containing protein [Streptococcus sp. WM07]